MIKLAFFLVKYLFSNKYRVIIAFSSKIDYLCFRVIQLCEVWGIRLIDFRNQFVTHPFLSLILQFVNQRDSLNGNNRIYTPLFVDLVDDYNQGVGYPSRCYDQIKMPQFVVNLFGAYRTWNDFESALRKYTGSYFTENQINEFLFYERSWLQRNGYI